MRTPQWTTTTLLSCDENMDRAGLGSKVYQIFLRARTEGNAELRSTQARMHMYTRGRK